MTASFALHARRTLKAPLRTARLAVAYEAEESGTELRLTGRRRVVRRDTPLVRLTAPVTVTSSGGRTVSEDPATDVIFLVSGLDGSAPWLLPADPRLKARIRDDGAGS